MARHRRCVAKGGDEPVVDVVDLNRAEAQPPQPGDGADLAYETREPVAGLAVAEAAEVDAGEDDLAVALGDPLLHLAEHRVGAAAAGGAAHERDHAEAAREGAAVLDLDERADTVEV